MITLRAVELGDLALVRTINQAAFPHVNSQSLADLDWFRVRAPYFKVAVRHDTPVAFLIALLPNIEYDSPNVQWFKRHRDRFVYVDRIVVAQPGRGLGIGQRLYRDLEDFTRPVAPIMTCEVNLRPPNPDSLRFHRQFGFVEVGRQETEGGAKEVVLMEKELRDREI